MDATPITLGQEFSGYVSQIEKGLKKIYESCDNLSELAIGGTLWNRFEYNKWF